MIKLKTILVFNQVHSHTRCFCRDSVSKIEGVRIKHCEIPPTNEAGKVGQVICCTKSNSKPTNFERVIFLCFTGNLANTVKIFI